MSSRIVPDLTAVADRWGIVWCRTGSHWINRYGRQLTEQDLIRTGSPLQAIEMEPAR